MAEPTHGDEIRTIWRDYRLFYKLLGAALLVSIGVLVGRAMFADEARGYEVNLFTEIIGIVVTVLIVNELAEQRAERKAVEALKRQLMDDAASNVNDVAKNAVHQLMRKGWLTGENGLLKSADLFGANLQGAKLTFANLQEVDLSMAELQGAKLGYANLQGAKLAFANLQEVDLSLAELQGASLVGSNLQGADLRWANLQNTTLSADGFDSLTRLPDGSHWSPETCMRRFTDPKNPDFWRSSNPFSPAYGGKNEAQMAAEAVSTTAVST